MKMVQNEFKFIAKNKIILISLIAIMIIPFLYSIFFLKSVWDPYGSTGNLPVAVVNNDVPTTYEGQKLNAGKDLVKELKKNDQIGWRFVSAKKAKQGLKDKEYYTVITLPKNFSANAATVLDKHPKKMQINYKTNDSLNFIAEVISEAGAKQVNAELRETVTKSYAKVMFKQVKTAGKGFTTAAKGAKKLTDGSITLADGLNTYTAGVDKVNDGVMTMKTSVVPLSDGVKKLADGSKALDTGLQTLNGKTGTLASGASQLNSGASQLNTGLQTLNSKTGALSTGVSQLNTGLQTLNNNSANLNGGADKLKVGITQLSAGSQQLNTALTDASKEITTSLSTGQPKIDELKEGMNQLDTGLSQLNAAMNGSETTVIAQKITTDLTTIGNNTQSTGVALAQAGTSLGQVKTKVYDTNSSGSVASQVGNVGAQLKTIAAVTNNADVQAALAKNPALAAQLKAALESASGSLTQTSTQIQSSGADLTSAGADLDLIKTNTISTGAQLKDVQTQLTTLMGTLQTLKTSVGQLSTGATAANVGVNEAISTLTAGLVKVNTGLSQTGDGSVAKPFGAIQATTIINAGLKQVQEGLNGTSTQPGLVPGLQAYTAGVVQASNGSNQLNSNVPALTGGIGQLASGSGQLAAGTAQLNSQVPQLTSGVSQLATGSTTLNGGLVQLNGKIPALTSGVDQLADGTSQLAANSTKLNSGATQLKNGNKTLTTGLNSGANKVNSIKLTNSTADMFAAPSDLKHSNYSYVPNYGHALAPYVLSLALFVGAIVFNFAYPIRKISMEGQSATAWFLSKIAVGAIVAIGMGLIEPALMMVAGLNVDHPAQFFLISVTFALTSMAIIMFLSMAFDNPGRFLAMVLLMLQLGGSGGTFPMEITNHFYNVIHPFLPMSYSILGFRQAITSGLGNGQIVQTFFVLLLFIAIALVLLWISMTHLQKIGQAGISQLDDNQKLQDVEK
ncbi:YhgE/Pip family protein [Latilactobacillus fuchuensis]|uniref:YhgE/Pip family protein n=1 Tax=Latilactobacillus fuchuensis TaxID=164393 RepID=UPI0039B00DF7